MKKILAIILVLIMVLSMSACKKDPPPVETMPPTTAPVEVEVEPTKAPPEIIPEIGDETMPPALTDNMTGSELRRLYENFVHDYDWSQHNGLIIEMSSTTSTYIFTDTGFIKDSKIKSEVYKDSYLSRYVICRQGDNHQEYLMCDDGSFGITQTMSNPPIYPQCWNLYNENTTSEYVRTKISDECIYDIVKFETTWGGTDEELTYTLQDTVTGDIYIANVFKDEWDVYSVTEEEAYYESVSFDLNTKVLTIESRKINVDIVTSPEEHSAQSTITIRAMLYIDRETQTAAFMEDLDRGTIVRFLTGADIDFTMPNNVRYDMWGEASNIMYVMDTFNNDIEKYLSVDPRTE